MIKRIDHVSVVVKDMDESLKMYKEVFGIEPTTIQTIPEQRVKAALLPLGDTELELIQPTDTESGVARFLESKGEGIHHICLEVDDVDKELSRLATQGVRLIDKAGRKGLAGKVGFIHPGSTKGVLIELAQKGAGHGTTG